MSENVRAYTIEADGRAVIDMTVVAWKSRQTARAARANLTGADLTGADLTDADLRIQKASPFVYDAIAAVQSARVALQKTRIEWLNQ